MENLVTVNDLLQQLNDSYFIIKIMGGSFATLLLIIGYFLKEQIKELKNVVSTNTQLQIKFAKEMNQTQQNVKDIDDIKNDIKSLFKANSDHNKCKNYKA